jgi:hypothetical protein
MQKRLLLMFLILGLVFLACPSGVGAITPLDVRADEAVIDFPNAITFRAQFNSDATINSVVLEYGSEQLTCGEVIAKAFPQFTPDTRVDVEWTWEMRQSGSLPPGAAIWWRWRVTDANGKETVSETKTVTWLDSTHNWQTISDQDLRLHWYRGDKAFAQELLAAARAGLDLNAKSAGLKPDGIIDLYIFADTSDLKDAVLYEPTWTGGQAFPEHNIVIIGIAQSDIDWGKDAIVHELTHVLVGHLTFSCLGDVPTWLNEGLAVYSEGGLDPVSQEQLDEAIRQDTLLTVRSLSGGFSEVSDKAYLSYSESYSIVKFLVETYGQEKMTALLVSLRDGTTVDDALVNVYAFDVDGLEDGWRAGIGAKARAAVPNPTATPQPTFVPTIVPVSGVPLAVTPTPFVVPTSSVGDGGEPSLPGPSGDDPLLILGIVLGLLCCCLLVVAIVGLVIYFVSRGRKGGRNA